jgi:glycosyltransferase involved in cell wall biosynthesis
LPSTRLTRTAVIPAYNEAATIAGVIERTLPYVDTVIVIDDGSTYDTASVASRMGALVLSEASGGYVQAIATGISAATSDIVITLDADGEHAPEEIPELVRPIEENRCDVVFGKLPMALRRSEQVIEWIIKRRLKVSGTSSGYRAIRNTLTENLNISGSCTCGVLAMELFVKGARICSIDVPYTSPEQQRLEHWNRHIRLLPRLLKLMLTPRKNLN